MRRRFIALGPSETLLEAERLMRMARVRTLPVAFEGALVGVLSYRALVVSLLGGTAEDRVANDASLHETRVVSLMDGRPCALTPGVRLEEAAARLVDRDEGCLPVVDELSETLVGILTEGDLLRAAYGPRPNPA
jgi:CBS domain-containing protein